MSNRRSLRGKDWAPLSRQISSITAGRETQLADEINRLAPGFLDQLEAANAELAGLGREMRRNARETYAGRFTEADPHDVPASVAEQIAGLYLRVITELATGERTHCGHISLEKPRPAIAAVHSDTAYCRRCFTSGKATRPQLTEREEHTCDLCGSYRHKQTMDAVNAQVGPFLLIIGICPRCSALIKRQSP